MSARRPARPSPRPPARFSPRPADRPSRRSAPRPLNPAGVHLLADRVAARLVAEAALAPPDLVLDLGAGLGALTLPLARTGARVIAVERDPRTAQRLAARLADHPNVRVVTGDILDIPLPRRPFSVVANIPFAVTTALLRRLHPSALARAHLVVEAAAGRRLAAHHPGRLEPLTWQLAHRFTLGRTIPAHQFRPAPPINAVVLRLDRYERSPSAALLRGVTAAYRTPAAPIGRLLGRAPARAAGLDPHAPVASLTAADWRRLYTQ
ncbi:ribosomal RNA small subunit methyltransferase A [Rhizomonospora bruguierae]|uniref:ribosomal RNA small subunit methyltransferase A n=1 Tax=Rhizomonospora bruguierae TaxID=1581705 RepID=UPI001BCC3A61|nr:rRNA adenine N(6)-methyltransferase family protein [Micromonospora sp. NBRC 107566]